MAQIPKKVIDRFGSELGKFQRILMAAKDRDVNEADTVTIVKDILADLFGFDKYSEITSEVAIRGTFCDLAVKIDGTIKYLIEVKAIGLTLKEDHLRQARDYGANHGAEWVVLTNGVSWMIRRIRFERPITTEPVCDFNLLQLSARKEDDRDRLFLLCKEGISKAAIQQFHERQLAVNRFILTALMLTDPVIDVLRRELRRFAPDARASEVEIRNILTNEVFKREVLDCEDAERARALVKKASSRQLRAVGKLVRASAESTVTTELADAPVNAPIETVITSPPLQA